MTISKARAAIQGALVVSDIVGQTLANVPTTGTAVAIPKGAHSVQIYSNGRARINIDASGTLSDAGYLQGSVQYTYGLHTKAGSLALAAATGSVNVDLNWLKAG